MAMRGSVCSGEVSGGGHWVEASEVRSERRDWSQASRKLSAVDPVLGRPIPKSGATISFCSISGDREYQFSTSSRLDKSPTIWSEYTASPNSLRLPSVVKTPIRTPRPSCQVSGPKSSCCARSHARAISEFSSSIDVPHCLSWSLSWCVRPPRRRASSGPSVFEQLDRNGSLHHPERFLTVPPVANA